MSDLNTIPLKTTLVTGPSYYPVSLSQAKNHLRVDHTDDDDYIRGLIVSATDDLERILLRRLVTQTWKFYRDKWPAGDNLSLPYGELQSVTHVKYTDSDGTQSTMSAAEYIVDTDSDPGRVVLDYGETWPGDTLYPSNPIEVQYVCGYGDNAPITITAASNASPIVLTASGHGIVTSDPVFVDGVLGNTAANGNFVATRVDDDNISLNGSKGNAAYTSGGTVVKKEIPQDIIHALFFMISDMYEFRETMVTGTMWTEKPLVKRLIRKYRL